LAKKTTIKWTDKQQKVNALLDQGKTRQEILQAGYAKTTIDDVIAARKSKRKEGGEGGNPPPPPSLLPGDRLKPQVLDLVQVGGLFIEPANWRINQHGVYLIMDTHERAKEVFSYEGTLGEFLCDCVQAMRNFMGVNLMPFDYFIKEDDNGTGRKEGQPSGGAGLLQQGGNGSESEAEPGGEIS
jgi:hypothetical protein